MMNIVVTKRLDVKLTYSLNATGYCWTIIQAILYQYFSKGNPTNWFIYKPKANRIVCTMYIVHNLAQYVFQAIPRPMRHLTQLGQQSDFNRKCKWSNLNFTNNKDFIQFLFDLPDIQTQFYSVQSLHRCFQLFFTNFI